MNKTIIKCPCGTELGEHDARFVIHPMTQEFVCPKCWTADREKRATEIYECCRCGKKLDGSNFVDHRYCYAPDKAGDIGFNLFCIECEPYTPMGDRH